MKLKRNPVEDWESFEKLTWSWTEISLRLQFNHAELLENNAVCVHIDFYVLGTISHNGHRHGP